MRGKLIVRKMEFLIVHFPNYVNKIEITPAKKFLLYLNLSKNTQTLIILKLSWKF